MSLFDDIHKLRLAHEQILAVLQETAKTLGVVAAALEKLTDEHDEVIGIEVKPNKETTH